MSALIDTHPTDPVDMPAPTSDVSLLGEGPLRLSPRISDDILADLRLDHVLASLSDGGKDSLMVELFTCRPEDPDTVEYRQEVCSDLRDPAVRSALAAFREGMCRIDERVASATTSSASEYHWQQRRRLAEATADYAQLVLDLPSGLEGAALRSRGMDGVRGYLDRYATSPPFRELSASTAPVIEGLDRVRFRIAMEMGQIVVSPAVSLVSQTAPEELNQRTFRVCRQKANGTARALARHPHVPTRRGPAEIARRGTSLPLHDTQTGRPTVVPVARGRARATQQRHRGVRPHLQVEGNQRRWGAPRLGCEA